tara:strand:- start:4473 stop:5552 length:1080 start_codon:yes stop_codon:yes gene_type:complete
MKPSYIYFFLIITISCNNYIKINNSNFNNESYLEYQNKKILINDSLVIPKNKTLIISGESEIKFNKNGIIINNGIFKVGENSKKYSQYYIKNDTLENIKSVVIIGNNRGSFIINNSIISIYNSKFKNINFNSYNGNLKFNNNDFNNSTLELTKSSIKTINCFLTNNSKLKIIQSENAIFNNNYFYKNNDVFIIKNTKNVNLLNNIFDKNSICIKLLDNSNNINIYNNLIIENKTFIQSNYLNKSTYILNNTFYKNQLVIYINIKKISDEVIISKNNIFSYNKDLFDLTNININNSYCLSDNYNLSGFYNLNSKEVFKNINTYDFDLLKNSPAIGFGTNNKNIGVNITNLYYYKYLKYIN